MKIVKRLFIALGAVLILLIGAAFAIPYFFKDELVALLKDEINKNVLAEVDFQDVDLSLFRSFPNLSLEVRDFSVVGQEPFAGVTLASGEALDFTLDLLSVFKSTEPVRIKAVNLKKPEINIFVTKDGRANYDIAVPTDERIEESAQEGDFSQFRVELESYSISEANLLYDDRSSDIFLDIDNLNHSGSGNFTLEVYDLVTQTALDAITVRQGGISYLSKAKATLDAIFNIDQKSSKYTLKDNELKINELLLNADGFVQMAGDDINMELSFNTPQNEFRNLLSMIPSAYIEGYENVKADGKFALSGNVKGTYNGEREQFPAFQVDLQVDNGQVKYPDLPLGISNIFAQASIVSPGSDFDDLRIDVPMFSLNVADNPFKARLKLRTPISDPDLDADVEGVINLAELTQAFPMEGIEEMSGIIDADVTAKTRMSYIDKGQYDRVDMEGNLTVRNINYKAEDLPAVVIRESQMSFTPQNVALKSFDAQLGRSDIQAAGTIDNILAYFSPEQTMKGNLTVRSKFFDADEWVPAEEEPSPSTVAVSTEEGGAEAETTEIFDRFDFKLDGRIDEIKYDIYRLKNTFAKGNMTPNRLEITEAATLIGESDIAVQGVITNIFDYVFDNGTLGGDLNIRSQQLDVNQFMVAEEGTATTTGSEEEELEPFLVPANINMKIRGDIDQLTYSNFVLKEVKGNILIEDEAVIIEDASTRTLGGRMNLSGGYDTKDAEEPAFSLKYDLQSLNFQDAFQTFNTFQQLAPIGRFIKGNLNSTLIMDGKLGKDLMPRLSTLNAKGFLETLNGVIENFKPLQAVSNSLNIKELAGAIPIDDTRNWFEIKNGVVEVAPFDFNYKDIAMNIAGRHGLNQEMDYQIKAQVPRELLEKNAVGAAAGEGFNFLQQEASKLGLNLKQGEFVNVQINLTGSLQDPKVKLKLMGMDGETSLTDAAEQKLKDELTQQKEKLQTEAEQKLEAEKKVLEEKAVTAVDSAKTVVTQKAEAVKDTLAKKAEQAVKDKVGEQVGAAVDTLLKDKGKEGIDQIKNELEKFNPFKKKKKEGGGG